MNGWISKKWITQPITNPRAAPITSTASIAAGAGQPSLSSVAHTIVVSATTEPTDRSIPPVRITNVIPTATTSRNELSMKMFSRIWVL